MLEAFMKEALISIIRQEHVVLESLIAAELRQKEPDGLKIEALQEEASDLARQLDRYEEH
jgi:hypothetical protein